jgi:hypothetical protein
LQKRSDRCGCIAALCQDIRYKNGINPKDLALDIDAYKEDEDKHSGDNQEVHKIGPNTLQNAAGAVFGSCCWIVFAVGGSVAG